jgi:hypothetical protein
MGTRDEMIRIDGKLYRLPPEFAKRRVLMPRNDRPAESLRLYRGAGWQERRRRLYGFSWTTRLNHARSFAEHWRQGQSGGVILETLAPPDAILLVRDDEGYYDEAEVVVDPFRLGKVTVCERLPAHQPA